MTGSAPRSARPPGIPRPPSAEVGFVGLLLLVLGATVSGWMSWATRIVGALMVLLWIVGRARWRARSGERVWLWDRI